MSEENREIFELLIDKLIEQALDLQKLVVRLDEMANANRDLIQENLLLSKEVE